MMHDEKIKTPDDEKSFYEDFFENAASMCLVSDAKGCIVKANKKAVETFFGPNQEVPNLEGKSLLDFVHKDDRELAVLLSKESFKERKEITHEIRMCTNDGRVLYILVSGRPIIREDRVVSFQYQAMDIIDQKVHEQNLLQSASTDILSQIAGGFAHDFNNMLTVINGYAEILKMSVEEAHPFHHKISQICQAGKQASVLTQRMLEFSRRSNAPVKTADINEEITKHEGIIRHAIGQDIRLLVVKSPGLKAVPMDPSRFSTLLLNLVNHARETMPRGGELTISTDHVIINPADESSYPQVPRGTYLLLTVKDTGEGMAEETRNQIFDPFISTEGTGHGIGLWTVQNIVKASKGSILVETQSGAGTTFRIFLPAPSSPVKTATQTDQEHAAKGTSKGSKTILVVEDDDTVRDLVSEILMQQGHSTFTARNGGDALQLARQMDGRIDLLITDMVMRRIDGRMLSKKMKSIWPHIKVMIMSGYGNDVIKEEDIRDNAFLQKPFLPQELIDKVCTVLQG